MGSYAVPENIRKQKPKGTMVKVIKGNYYVYEYTNITDVNGKQHKKMGRLIGSIKEDCGFVPNDHYVHSEDILTLEYGQYALALANSQDVLEKLQSCFNAVDARRIYTIALIHFVNNFTYMRDLKTHYDMSYLSIKYPNLKMGYGSVAQLYDDLGRRQGPVLKFQQMLINNSTGEVALDGHAIPSTSEENDLAEKGNKYLELGYGQINLMTAYDINTETPLLSKIYEGGNLDKISVSDFFESAEFKDKLFVMDAGFYSTGNVKMFAQDNYYIVPPLPQTKHFQTAMDNQNVDGRFIYRANRKNTVIEYSETKTTDGHRVIKYRDVNLAALSESDFLLRVEEGKYPAYTMERFESIQHTFGVIILQTNLKDKTAKEIYELYKNRWKIETYYNYFKNGLDCRTLHSTDYYKTQGLAFIMLISSLIYHNVKVAVKNLKTKHIEDCLLDARMVKINKKGQKWVAVNCKSTLKDMFAAMNTDLTP